MMKNKLIPKSKRSNAFPHFQDNYNLLKPQKFFSRNFCSDQESKRFLTCKKAQGHVEMMLSFILFISAILFIFAFMNPFSKSVDKSNELEQTQRAIMQQISDKAGRLSAVSYDPTECYDFINSEYPGNYVEFAGSTPKKYTIYFSDKFNSQNAPHKVGNPLSSCLNPLVENTDYKLGVFSNETIILYDSLKDFAADCSSYAGYQQKRRDLGISMDFVLNITDMNREPLADLNFAKRISGGVDVKSKEFPIKIIKSDGTVIDAIFNIRVW